MKYNEFLCAEPYARYVALLLHHGNTPEEQGGIVFYQDQLKLLGFNDWGRALARWPPALDEYLIFCRELGFDPVVTELEEDCRAMGT